VKRDLYEIDLSILEDLLLEQLLCEKRREIDMQLTMLAARNTNGFRPASMLLYGAVTPQLLDQALSILSSIQPKAPRQAGSRAGEVAAEARALVDRYRRSIRGSPRRSRFATTSSVSSFPETG
jgi:hypothetical protein